MLNSQGRVPVGPQVHLFVESGLASEMARTTPTGGEVARLEMLAVWGVARETRIRVHRCPAGLGARLPPKYPGLDLSVGQPGRVQPRHPRH